MIRHILLAVDTDTSSAATKIAGDLAAVSGATVEVFHADELNAHVDTAIWLDDDTEPREAVGNALAELSGRGITVRVVTARTTSTGSLFVGSVAADVAARTTIPLLLVPER